MGGKIGGRRRALFEHEANGIMRVAQPPDFSGQPRVARRAGAAGCPFLWLLSFGQAKERMPAAGLPPAIQTFARSATKPTQRPAYQLPFNALRYIIQL
jgi:hypothetical protein